MKLKSVIASIFIVAVFSLQTNAQNIFSDLKFPEYHNASNGSGQLKYGIASFINSYNETYKTASGFSVSKVSDTQTPGYTNQYASCVGHGADDSEVYLICNNTGKIKFAEPSVLNSCKITNSTYAYLSMKNGDNFAKKFGGATGNDPDWFKITITGYGNGKASELEVYLADFRFEDNEKDYILDKWQEINLAELGLIDSLEFALSSTDNHPEYGMNTPAYFCLDDLKIKDAETLTFENTNFNYWNGQDRTGKFSTDEITFYNSFIPNTFGGFWSGFAYSKETDTNTPGFQNQYSTITGGGFNNEANYAVAYQKANLKLDNPAYLKVQITNSTYAYLSMRDGDGFAKKFGGATGNDPDWFKTTATGFLNGEKTNSTDIYLADFRFSDNAKDYILDKWTEFDLSSLGLVDSLEFTFSSSDNHPEYGMNTPAYFCLGNIATSQTASVDNQTSIPAITIYPNPAKDFIQVMDNQFNKLIIRSISGKIINTVTNIHQGSKIDISKLPQGIYIVTCQNNEFAKSVKLVKVN